MKVISLFSGVGTFDHGFHQAGWQTVHLCEWDKHARKVLAHRFPGVPITEDVRDVRGDQITPADCIMFGSPCQDISVAGKRSGMTEGTDTRSSLFFEAVRVIKEMREATDDVYPRFALWENVPGAFSSNGGRDFAAVVRAFLLIGARDVSWRVLDSRYFGVPQRRRRIFLVADFGGEAAHEILFEPKGMHGNPQESRGEGQEVAACLTTGTGKRYDAETETLIPVLGTSTGLASTLTASAGHHGHSSPRGDGTDNVVVQPILSWQQSSMEGKGTLGVDLDTHTLRPVKPQSDHQMIAQPIAFDWKASISRNPMVGPLSPTLETQDKSAVLSGYAVRRLTPEECEALQGMPRGWTDVDGMADSHRYRFMGNGGTSYVLTWIAERMAQVMA